MTGESDEGGWTHSWQEAPAITWRPTNVRDLLEARLTDGDAYVGYIVRRAGESEDEWHGYVGVTHVLVAVGTREVVQAVVERAAREVWATRRSAEGHKRSDRIPHQRRWRVRRGTGSDQARPYIVWALDKEYGPHVSCSSYATESEARDVADSHNALWGYTLSPASDQL